MDYDDAPVGRLLQRREVLALLGLTGIAVLAGRRSGFASSRTLPQCVVRPTQTEGPYFVEARLNRTDIRSDPATDAVTAGALLDLTFNVSRISDRECSPLRNAQVDVWQCDALGIYSDVNDPGFNTVGQKFLRGYQLTDDLGRARFTTIYPGWYQGRTVHIHFKIRTDPASARGFELTSQLYFDDALTDRVHAAGPYAAKGQRTRRNSGEGIFRRGGQQLLLAVVETPRGYAAAFDVGLQMD